jgi:hypothetical protein
MPRKTPALTQSQLTSLRDVRYRRKASLRLKSSQDAVRFVNEVGFCMFWPIHGVEMPSLWAAVAGNRPVADAHDDPGHVTWGWKDQSLDKRWWFYAKLLRGKSTLVSLKMLPYFYALSENFGGAEDYLEAFRAGRLSIEAKSIYETLRDQGAMDSVRLRREARLSADSAKTRFDKALTELQKDLKILPIGVAQAGAWRYAFIYELVERWFPDLLESARTINRSAARAELLRRHLENVIAVTPAAAGRLFGWRKDETQAAVARLVESKKIVAGVKVGDEAVEHLVAATAFK